MYYKIITLGRKELESVLNSDVVIYRGKITGDFNNYKSTGFHQYDGGSALNSPTTGGAIVLVLSGPTYTIQLSMSHNAITARRWNGSVWSEWY